MNVTQSFISVLVYTVNSNLWYKAVIFLTNAVLHCFVEIQALLSLCYQFPIFDNKEILQGSVCSVVLTASSKKYCILLNRLM